jgi:hypothetical protein
MFPRPWSVASPRRLRSDCDRRLRPAVAERRRTPHAVRHGHP